MLPTELNYHFWVPLCKSYVKLGGKIASKLFRLLKKKLIFVSFKTITQLKSSFITVSYSGGVVNLCLNSIQKNFTKNINVL